MTDHKGVLVNGIKGLISQSKYQWLEGKKWHCHPSIFISLSTGEYEYAGTGGKFPSKEDGNDFAKVYFILQSLVDDGVFYAPQQGDDAMTLWSIFWYTKKPIDIDEFVKLLSDSGLSIIDRKA